MATEGRRVRFNTFGAYLPEKRVPSTDIDAAMGLESGTCQRSSGVAQRHYSDISTETQSYMAAQAVNAALRAANLQLSDIDGLVNTSGTGEQEVPSNAALTLRELHAEAHPIPAFDINATCMGFLVGLDMISYPLAMGRYQRVAIVSSEIASLGLDPTSLETRPLFGDGACAAIVERCEPADGSRILASAQEVHVAGVEHCQLVGGRSRLPPRDYAGNESRFCFAMDGKLAMRMAAKVAPDLIDRVLCSAGVRLADVSLIVPHQASRVGMEIVKRRMGISDEQWMWNLTDYGNMISASIPLAMHTAIQQGRIRRGDKVLMTGTSAGFGIAAILLEY